MRIEIRQTGTDEGFAKYGANGRGAAPIGPIQPCGFKLTICPQGDARRGKEGIVIAPEFIFRLKQSRRKKNPPTTDR